jgi:7,8-dihydropterin-6-yl-methyl-4-(beta-D-ribofuranosyl)aminobenzene 5'-phosphate synthase
MRYWLVFGILLILVSCPLAALLSTSISLTDLAATPTHAGDEAMIEQPDSELTITIVFDNKTVDPAYTPTWGFAALVEYGDHTLLFDTGADGTILLDNMAALGIDPLSIDSVVLSHIHGDHVGGLASLQATGVRPVVYVPPSFPDDFKRRVGEVTTLVEVEPGQVFAKGLFTTGEMGGGIREQALIIKTTHGLVVITGCAHPGVANMVMQAKDLFDEPVYLVLGGFHLSDRHEAEIAHIIESFRQMDVQKVAPCHCTGDEAIQMFADEYGEDFIEVGAGTVIVIEAGTETQP